MRLLRLLLLPFTFLYSLAVRLKNHLYDIGYTRSFTFDIPVIVVGNLSVGGTGKSPMVEYLVRLLIGTYSIAILSRGYKRKTKGFRIHVTSADGSGSPVAIGKENRGTGGPSWSPDGSKIAYHTSGPSLSFIRVINADGTGNILLATGSSFDSSPSWSPDGTKIIFMSDRETSDNSPMAPTDIFVMNTDGSDLAQLTSDTIGGNFEPKWSPNGEKILFSSDRDGDLEIFVMNTDGSNEVQLTSNSAADFQPLEEAAVEIEILLLGCGEKAGVLPPEHRARLKGAGISAEVMGTGAACRTFNVLQAEGRRVAALLIAVP